MQTNVGAKADIVRIEVGTYQQMIRMGIYV
jgi:hypothetical protein